MYLSKEVNQHNVDYDTIIYSADAEKLNSTWTNDGFSLVADSFTTGRYESEVRISAASPAIKLPGRAPSSKIYLKLTHSLQSESHYDIAFIRIRNVKSQEDYPLYLASGLAEGTEYIDMTYHAGCTISLEMGFVSDSSFHGAGWSIGDIEIVASKLPCVNHKEPIKRYPSPQNSTDIESSTDNNTTISLDGIRLEITGVQWINSDTGIVAFNLKNDSTYLNQNLLNANDFVLQVNGQTIESCKDLLTDTTKKNVDMIFAVDCSSSMKSMQNSLDKSIDTLVKALQNKYTCRFAEVQFGSKNDYKYLGDLSSSDFDFKLSTSMKGFEYYYDVLIYIANHKFSYSVLSQKVIVMIGDEPIINSSPDNNPNNIKQDSVANTLKLNNFQTFIVNQEDRYVNNCPNINGFDSCRTSFEKICEETRGKYIVARNENDSCSKDNLTFSPEEIVNSIGASLNKRYYMQFCLADSIKSVSCGDSILVSLTINATNHGDSINTLLNYLPTIKRDSITELYDDPSNHICDSLNVQFSFLNTCPDDSIKNVEVCFKNDTVTKETCVPAYQSSDGTSWYAKVPMTEAQDSIHYRISAENSWATINLPSNTNEFFTVSKKCLSLCSAIRLSANPITASSDSIFFELSKKGDVHFALLDQHGANVYSKSGQVLKTVSKPLKGDVRLSLFQDVFPDASVNDFELLTPYILAVSLDKQVFMTYIYFSRIDK